MSSSTLDGAHYFSLCMQYCVYTQESRTLFQDLTCFKPTSHDSSWHPVDYRPFHPSHPHPFVLIFKVWSLVWMDFFNYGYPVFAVTICWSTILAPGVGNGNTIPYSMDRGAWQVAVYGVAESPTWLSNWAHPSSIELLWQVCQNLVGCSWYSIPFHGLCTSSSANTTHSWLLLLYNMSWDSTVILPVLFCFLKTVTATPVPLPFNNNFRRVLCISTKDLPGIMITVKAVF